MDAAAWGAAAAAVAMAVTLALLRRHKAPQPPKGAPAAATRDARPGKPPARNAAKAQPAKPAEESAPPPGPSWGVRLEAPPGDAPTCQRARGLVGTCFRNEERPPLPLPGCTLPHDCACRYVKLPERRLQERRSGHDRRDTTRYDPKGSSDRRSGKDRRRRNASWS